MSALVRNEIPKWRPSSRLSLSVLNRSVSPSRLMRDQKYKFWLNFSVDCQQLVTINTHNRVLAKNISPPTGICFFFRPSDSFCWVMREEKRPLVCRIDSLWLGLFVDGPWLNVNVNARARARDGKIRCPRCVHSLCAGDRPGPCPWKRALSSQNSLHAQILI